MLNIRTQIVVAAVLIIALVIIINMVRRKRLELRYALAWLGVGIGTLFLDCFPQVISWLSKMLGIASPTNMLFFSGFIFSLVIIFILTVSVSRTSIRIKQLAQEIALLEKECKEKEEKSMV